MNSKMERYVWRKSSQSISACLQAAAVVKQTLPDGRRRFVSPSTDLPGVSDPMAGVTGAATEVATEVATVQQPVAAQTGGLPALNFDTIPLSAASGTDTSDSRIASTAVEAGEAGGPSPIGGGQVKGGDGAYSRFVGRVLIPETPETPNTLPVREETFAADDGGSDRGSARSNFGLPGGIRWEQARWAQSWGFRFVEGQESARRDVAALGAESLYAAVLAASGGSVIAEGRVVHDPAELRSLLGRWMRNDSAEEGLAWPGVKEAWASAYKARMRSMLDGPLSPAKEQGLVERSLRDEEGRQPAAWDYILRSITGLTGTWPELEDSVAPPLISQFLGKSLLVLHPDGRISAYGSGPTLVLAQGSDSGGKPRWMGAPAATDDPVLDGLSPQQVEWAAKTGMVFVGPRGSSDPFDALEAVGRVAGVEALLGGLRGLRTQLARAMQDDPARPGSLRWMDITDQYVEDQYVGTAGSEGQRDAFQRMADGRAWTELIAGVEGGFLTDPMLQVLVHHYLGVSVTILHADGRQVSFREGGQPVTVAQLVGSTAGSGNQWIGLAPVGPPLALGAITRPADVAGGRRTPAPISRIVDGTEPVVPVGPVGRASAGASTAQRKWALDNHFRFVEVPAGPDGLLEALVQATDGGFTTTDGVFVKSAGDLRTLLAGKIRQLTDAHPGFWQVVYSIYEALYYQRENPADDEAARTLSEQIGARINGGQALDEIIASIEATSAADSGYWPQLAEQVVPFFANRLGLAVRVVERDGAVNRYGKGRPVFIAPITDEDLGGRRWVALPPAAGRFAGGSPLSSPNLSDPALVRLGRALDATKAAGGDEAVASWLRGVAERWQASASVPRSAPTRAPGDAAQGAVLSRTPDDLRETVDGLGRIPGLGDPASPGAGERTAAGVITSGLSLGAAVELFQALFDERGGVGVPAATGQITQGGPPSGIAADQWVASSSLRELVEAIPFGGAALVFDGTRSWVAIDTTDEMRLVKFDSADPSGRVSAWNDEVKASLDRAGLGLVVDINGLTLAADQLEGPFTPATGWDGDLNAEPAGDLMPAGISAAQDKWAREHQVRFGALRTGPNAVFQALIDAVGGELTVDGEQVGDASTLRKLATGHLPRTEAGHLPWTYVGPMGAMVFAEFQDRIVVEHLDNNLSVYHRQAVFEQISAHLADRSADGYIRRAFDRPGHWEPIVHALAPAALADLTGMNLLVVGADGRVRAYGDPQAPRVVLARTDPSSAAPAGWGALVPEAAATIGSHPRPVAGIEPDIEIRPTEPEPAGAPAALTAAQLESMGKNGLLIGPATGGFLHAVRAATQDRLAADRYTPITTDTDLREFLAKAVRERPDLLDEETWQGIRRTWQEIRKASDKTDPGIEDIVDTLAAADRTTTPDAEVDIIKHLISPYTGYQIRVLEPEGEIKTYGTGVPITIAKPDRTGSSHWAVLTPTATAHPQDLPGLPPLSDLLDLSPSPQDWHPDDFTVVQGGAARADDLWRSPTFCAKVWITREDGTKELVPACVSVTVITIDRPLATIPGAA
ncbi:hypothetical protein [Actinoallomurus rhizosphaericola]|uniref:hypothetical protein n=1 Tax=Actinoallomurus rhizosphaericola TaxID=2952536 RepID=UPI0020930BB9|nr:hypothetical protein [Actinoallomurus rhizosphaericola]MCO6000261.1 hypothetical protein [Actinoallomurus rhizosphaericola]